MNLAVAAVPAMLWRVHARRHGPLNPRVPDGVPDTTWGRFDVPAWATVYGAHTRRGAFLETLAYARPDPALTEDLGDLFDSTERVQSVAEQWAAVGIGHMPPGTISTGWREDRQISQLDLSAMSSASIVDLSVSDTIGALRGSARQWLPDGHPLRQNPSRLDLSDLTGSDRTLTCALAWWLARQTLADGSIPAGIRYVSRHGTDLTAYALWVDLAKFPPSTTVSEAVSTRITARTATFEARDPDYCWAAQVLGLRVA